IMANIAQTVNVLQAMILTDPETGALVLTPTYHVFAMNAGHQDARALDAHVLLPEEVAEVNGRALPMLSASASTTGETALVSLSNLDLDQERTLVSTCGDAQSPGTAPRCSRPRRPARTTPPSSPMPSHPARSRRCASTSAA